MDGKPIELINKALALDGKNIKALLLRGTWEIQKNDLPAAEKSFVLAKSFTEPNSGFAQIADNALAEIKSRQSGATTNAADKSGATPARNATAEPASAAGAAGVTGMALASVTLKLSAEARTAASAASATSAVFLIVRAAGAERGPPLAAKKLALADIEKPILLTAADAMIGGAGLKPGADVVLQARLSLTGQPMAQAGDWQSAKTNATLPSTALILAIDALVKN
jgi:cytochrome c-type biogenesis protein CcmH